MCSTTGHVRFWNFTEIAFFGMKRKLLIWRASLNKTSFKRNNNGANTYLFSNIGQMPTCVWRKKQSLRNICEDPFLFILLSLKVGGALCWFVNMCNQVLVECSVMMDWGRCFTGKGINVFFTLPISSQHHFVVYNICNVWLRCMCGCVCVSESYRKPNTKFSSMEWCVCYLWLIVPLLIDILLACWLYMCVCVCVYILLHDYNLCFNGFWRQLQSATILTGLIAALTRFPELLLYAYPCITMTTSSDLETVDVSWITWVNCSFRKNSQGFQNKPSGVEIDPYKAI